MNRSTPISSVDRSKGEASAAYDRMSRYYDLLAGSSEKKYREAGLRMLDARAGETVLEIGFGTGNCLVILAKSVGDLGRVFGIDLSAGMVSAARDRLSTAGLDDHVGLMNGDAVKLPCEDGGFDAIFISFTLELFDTPEIPLVLRECWRVLRPGGRMCVVAMARKETSGLMVRIYEWFHEKFTKYVDCRPIYVRQSLEEAGFITSKVEEMVMFGLPVDIVLAYKGEQG